MIERSCPPMTSHRKTGDNALKGGVLDSPLWLKIG